MSMKNIFNRGRLPNGDAVTVFEDKSTLTQYGNSHMDHKPGDKIWRNAEGQFHRDDGPAVEWATGHKEWRQNGHLHRNDGPAIERVQSGDAEYWLKGQKITAESAIEAIKENSSSAADKAQGGPARRPSKLNGPAQ